MIQECVEEFGLNKEEVFTNLKNTVDDNILKMVNNSNKDSYHVAQETHSDEQCVIIDGSIDEILESTVVYKISQLGRENSTNILQKLVNEFRLFKTSYRVRKAQGLLSYQSEKTIQNRTVNKNCHIKISDFIINLLKYRVFLLERQLTEKNSIIDSRKAPNVTRSDLL